jgi:hypothetical protein
MKEIKGQRRGGLSVVEHSLPMGLIRLSVCWSVSIIGTKVGNDVPGEIKPLSSADHFIYLVCTSVLPSDGSYHRR